MRYSFALPALVLALAATGCAQGESRVEAAAPGAVKISLDKLLGNWKDTAPGSYQHVNVRADDKCNTQVRHPYLVETNDPHVLYIGSCFVADDTLVLDPREFIPRDLDRVYRSQVKMRLKEFAGDTMIAEVNVGQTGEGAIIRFRREK